MNGVDMVKQLIAKKNHVVLMPYHKSFADFVVLQHMHLNHGLPPMYFFACQEDVPKIALFDNWLSNVGFIRYKKSQDISMQTYYLQSALFKEVVEHS